MGDVAAQLRFNPFLSQSSQRAQGVFMGHGFTQNRPPRVAKHCGQVNTDCFFTAEDAKNAEFFYGTQIFTDFHRLIILKNIDKL